MTGEQADRLAIAREDFRRIIEDLERALGVKEAEPVTVPARKALTAAYRMTRQAGIDVVHCEDDAAAVRAIRKSLDRLDRALQGQGRR